MLTGAKSASWRDVRYWHKADNPTAPANVRYGGEADIKVCRLQILNDVSNLIQTRMCDRLRLTTTGRFPTNPRLERRGTPIDRRWLASNECDVCVCV